MKVYKEIANISYDAFNSQKFTSEIAKYLKKYQDKNMEVEIQYSTCIENNTVIYSALILAYTEE